MFYMQVKEQLDMHMMSYIPFFATIASVELPSALLYITFCAVHLFVVIYAV